MKHVRLLRLKIDNWRGIRRQTFNFDEKLNSAVFGTNGIGKSSILAATCWCLTGKDEFDREDFDIKNTKLTELNKLPHEVEATFKNGDDEMTFKRSYFEKHVKPRGETEKVFAGHSTDYFVNGVPVKEKEFIEKGGELIRFTAIPVLMNPKYFVGIMTWQKQRAGLLGLAGTITTADIEAALPKTRNFSHLLSLLPKKSLAEILAENKPKKKLLSENLVAIPTRIDEQNLNRPLPEDWESISNAIDLNKSRIDELTSSIENSVNQLRSKQDKVRRLQTEKFETEQELAGIQNQIVSSFADGQAQSNTQISELESSISSLNSQVLSKLSEAGKLQDELSKLNQKQEDNEKTIVSLREDWHAINNEKFDYPTIGVESVCPSCGQDLPVHKIEEAQTAFKNAADKKLSDFNKTKQERLTLKVNYSNEVKAAMADRRIKISETETAISALKNELPGMESTLISLKNKVTQLKLSAKSQTEKASSDKQEKIANEFATNASAIEKRAKIASIDTQIADESRAFENTSTIEEKDERQKLEETNIQLSKKLAVKDSIQRVDDRIKELEEEERRDAQALADIEKLDMDVEVYRRTHMSLLETRVNKKFKHVKFKLFQPLVNGGVEETCECTYDDVAYSTLNTAAQILSGIDVINAFAEFFGVTAPIFVDHRESVIELPETDAQVISLIVSEEDKKFRVQNYKGTKILKSDPANTLFDK